MSRAVYVLGAMLAAVLLAGVISVRAQAETLVASYYGNELAGSPTASGEPFDPYGYTAASLTYPLGTQLRVCYQGCVNVTVNDRGPYVAGRDLDLSLGAAQAIGLTAAGVAPVDVTVLGSGDTGSTSAPENSSSGAEPLIYQEQPAAGTPVVAQTPSTGYYTTYSNGAYPYGVPTMTYYYPY